MCIRDRLYTQSSIGNGQIDEIYDIIYIDVDKFNKLKTLEMAEEIDMLNKEMNCLLMMEHEVWESRHSPSSKVNIFLRSGMTNLDLSQKAVMD